MPHEPPVETAVSAPGKVLLTGGYLVLDRNYTGTVLALNARIHVIVQQLPMGKGGRRTSASAGQSPKGGLNVHADGDTPIDGMEGDVARGKEHEEQSEEMIIVKSPQFIDAVWEYRIQRVESGGGVKVQQVNDGPQNPFIETSLNYALTYVSYVAASKHFGSLSVTILADNDYYSETATSSIPNRGGRFVNFGVKLQEAHKTGLGSSAALVTALVSAIVIHRTVQPEELPSVRDKLHNLAQAAHCAAQGKVGSGFDIAAAVYGSCLYRRFSPSVLSDLGEVGSPQFEQRLFTVVEDLNTEKPWDTECVDFGFKLPRGLQMVLCDVDCGSQTPGMVKKVLEWREQNRGDAELLWTGLQRNNEKLRLELKRLAQNRNVVQNYDELSNLITRTRMWIKSMTKECGVPIEPEVQTELLNAFSKIDGVIGGVVPGAGGYDALVLLVKDDPAVMDAIHDLADGWKSSVQDDFGGKIGKVRLLGVGYGSEGLKNELAVRYSGWI
ncbi:phosphomevalonate kinase, putative [Coccidioides posadasii C735 delta SOWgp]|uniref:Phosphomevalonate kinase n=1 Tax=Coccidioides posadasii (strain C735) TaxID=222929 RepID=C5PI41_COCP7|nr:phosphomevalonate kinase, putative [Coccidioides posadasii C735 delta SOWgp]EER24194.1 phosphomevalonate kinase, putative [Coccidioides posadasii C735 delta SOWgp]|eukprot:XP_003066339.1 phosphomevalonate kinase, putative [Coccidioides posadasii C735 delta SOWgp]